MGAPHRGLLAAALLLRAGGGRQVARAARRLLHDGRGRRHEAANPRPLGMQRPVVGQDDTLVKAFEVYLCR